MSKAILTAPYFRDEAAAFAMLESIVWPNGPVCPKCGAVDRIGSLEGVTDKKGRVRLGLKKCYHCRSQFTVRVGTVFESSHVPLHLWFQAVYLMCSSKKGVSSNQLHRTLGVTLKTAWFMSHRIREAMVDGTLPKLGGEGKAIEADETYIGTRKGIKKSRGGAHKNKVVTLVERRGKARSFHVDMVSRKDIKALLLKNADTASVLNTDEAGWYVLAGKEFAKHEAVNHSKEEYVRGDAHTNTVEGFYSVFKRGMKGI